jgi:hypothetical protein
MSASAARRLAWSLEAICIVLAILTVVFLALGAGASTPAQSWGQAGYGGLALAVASLAFVTVGALIASRVPGNAIGWTFCLTGLLLGVGDFAYQYADHSLYVAPGSLPGGMAAAWLYNLGSSPAVGLLGVSLLLFPDGRLPSRRWRPALWLAILGIACVVSDDALRPGPLDEPFSAVSNPVGIDGTFELMDTLAGLGWPSMAAAVAVAAVAMALRLRRSRGAERQQLKWMVVAAAVVGVVIVAAVASWGLEISGITRPSSGISQLRTGVLGLGFTIFPVAAGIAILRYRLYDIDVVINRTLVYSALTATLVGAYLTCVLVLQIALSPLTAQSDLAIAGSTLAVAALFGPARRRVQALVDRRFFRRRYDAARTLEQFGARLRDEVELDALGDHLRGVVRETVQPAHASLWLRGREGQG